MKIKIDIPGNPIAQKRHRRRLEGNFTRTYDPSSTDKENFLWKAILSNKPDKPIEGAISIKIICFMPRPKAHYKTSGHLKIPVPHEHIKRPDLDNMIKFALDSLNGIYWHDDSQIYEIIASKYYNITPCTIIDINY